MRSSWVKNQVSEDRALLQRPLSREAKRSDLHDATLRYEGLRPWARCGCGDDVRGQRLDAPPEARGQWDRFARARRRTKANII
ncbi:hypothetical protein EVAR_26765_1 [Eumeta japonica]|uniref:Uncharacterized protein n=1 Tax=Eumeta variegata TaxID=151549 RepID=A0A4C1XF37_EUMVA|nr:hypothetical protein EVAR_26765_1 [Eumeta japonica]